MGRWNLCNNKNIGLVVDYSNEDHCGTCSSHGLKNIDQQNVRNMDDSEMYTYDYICMITNIQEKWVHVVHLSNL